MLRTPHAYRVLILTVLAAVFLAHRLPGQTVLPPDPYGDGQANFFFAQQPVPPDTVQPPVAPDITPPDTLAPVLEADRATTPRPPLRTQTTPARRFSGLRLASADSPALRLASVPNMLGDFFGQTLQFQFDNNCGCDVTSEMTVPLAAGGRRTKISDNNKSLPMDRVYFQFNHFHNVVDSDPDTANPFDNTSGSLNRYTIGVEKTFLQNQVSLDIRLPLAEKYRSTADLMSAEGGDVGNLALIIKGLLWATPTCAVSAGLGINFPTGSSINGRVFDTEYTFKNEAFYLTPFIGFLNAPNDNFFVQGFLGVDLPTQGNGMYVSDPTQAFYGDLGTINDQKLLQVDLTGGWWIYRNPGGRTGITALAAIAEYHYTTTLNNADVLHYQTSIGNYRFGNLLNRVDYSYMTAGLHAQICATTTVRAAVVFPLENRLDNPYDAEVNFSLNKYY